MSKEEKESWEKRYAGDEYKPRERPPSLLVNWIGRLPKGKALELACGTGRNSLYLAEKGYDVTAVDISFTAIKKAKEKARERGLKVHWILADLDTFRPHGKYDVIVDFFYSNRALVPYIMKALRPGGILIYAGHLVTPDPVAGPPDHRFRFQREELRDLFQGLNILYYDEGLLKEEEEEGRHAAVASLVAQKTANNRHEQ